VRWTSTVTTKRLFEKKIQKSLRRILYYFRTRKFSIFSVITTTMAVQSFYASKALVNI